MDKEEATKILAKELVKANGQKYIVNPAHQKHLLETAVSFYPIEYKKKSFSFHFKIESINTSDSISKTKVEDFAHDCEDSIIQFCSKIRGANYVFIDTSTNLTNASSKSGNYDTRFFSHLHTRNNYSFFALIGEEEKKELKKQFYKDVPLSISRSFDVLDIENFIRLYKEYSCIGEGTTLKKKELEQIKIFFKFVNGLSHYHDEESADELHNLDSINELSHEWGLLRNNDFLKNKFKELNVNLNSLEKNIFSDKSVQEFLDIRTELGRKFGGLLNQEERMLKENFNSIRRSKNIEEFLAFVFSLPYEEQNISMNKELLKDNDDSGLVVEILSKEYSEGKHFEEYFNAMHEYMQERFVDILEKLPKKNIHYNSFMWNKGFDKIELDHINLFKGDAKNFIKYFKDKSVETKKVMLDDIMQCDFTNQEVIDWLDENEIDLMREVSFR